MSTLKALIHLCNPPSSLLITMNSSTIYVILTSLYNLETTINASWWLKYYFLLIFWQGIAFELVSILVAMFLCYNLTMMYMKRLWNHVWKNLNLIWSLAFLLNLSQIHHPKKKLKSILIVSKLTLVIIDFLFHNYFASHFRLMFYVLCKDI